MSDCTRCEETRRWAESQRQRAQDAERERDEARHDAAQAHGVAQALELRLIDMERDNLVANLRALLRELEWVEMAGPPGVGCHFCDVPEGQPHAPDCRLAAALKEEETP